MLNKTNIKHMKMLQICSLNPTANDSRQQNVRKLSTTLVILSSHAHFVPLRLLKRIPQQLGVTGMQEPMHFSLPALT